MANVVTVNGPDSNGNYKAVLSNGQEMTCGPTQDPRWRDPSRPDRYWFVSIGSSSDHTTFIVEANPDFLENEGMAQIRAIKSRGDDKSTWRMYAVAVLNQ